MDAIGADRILPDSPPRFGAVPKGNTSPPELLASDTGLPFETVEASARAAAPTPTRLNNAKTEAVRDPTERDQRRPT